MLIVLFNRVFRKILRIYRTNLIKKKYKIKGTINIFGRVLLDNENIKFGNNVSLYDGVHIWGDGEIHLGENVSIGKDTIIFSHQSISIGSNTSISAQCYIIDSDHGIKKNELIRNQELVCKKVFIGEDVWVGAGTKVLKGSIIGDGCVIGAMSLVNNSLLPYSINVGIPTKKISDRSN